MRKQKVIPRMNKELVQQLVFLTSILAGFTLSAVVSLVLHERADKQHAWFESWTIIAFSLATMLFVGTTVALGFFLFGPDEFSQVASQKPALQNILEQSQVWGFLAFCGGYICFMAGLSLIGWWHSRLVGWVTSIAAVAALLIPGFTLVRVSSLLIS